MEAVSTLAEWAEREHGAYKSTGSGGKPSLTLCCVRDGLLAPSELQGLPTCACSFRLVHCVLFSGPIYFILFGLHVPSCTRNGYPFLVLQGYPSSQALLCFPMGCRLPHALSASSGAVSFLLRSRFPHTSCLSSCILKFLVRAVPSAVVARFSDGSEAVGDVVVGADGSRSAVRTALYESPNDRAGNGASTAVCEHPGASLLLLFLRVVPAIPLSGSSALANM